MRKIKESWHHKSATIIEFDRAMNLPHALLSAGRGHGAAPRQRQLIQRLKQAILAGQLPAGGKLPSSRTLADELDISRNTVLIAYEQLTAEGYVVADRQGTRVAPLSAAATSAARQAEPPQPAPFTAARLGRIASTRAQRRRPAADAGHAGAEPVPRQRLAPRAGPRCRPRVRHAGLRHPMGEAARRHRPVPARLARVRCDASHVVITEGAQGALALCVQLLTNPGDTAWLEEPGYRGAKSAFHAGDLDVVPMRVDADGLAITEDAWRKPPRLIQATPTHQYPTGAVLSVARRLDLLERARRVGAWIIEDDYDSEFRHQGEPIAAMQGLLPDAPVLYVGTFSKTMFPALRLGFLVLPPALAASATPSIIEMLRGGHRLEQLTMATFIENGQFSRHLGRMRRLYRERQAARDALAAHGRGSKLGGHSGLHLTVRLPPCFPDTRIAEQARRGHEPQRAVVPPSRRCPRTTDW